jgi:hypothetical protein
MRALPEADLNPDEIEAMLIASARSGDEPAPLAEFPDKQAVAACHKFHQYMVNECGLAKELDDLYNQRHDPYERKAAAMLRAEDMARDLD